MLLFFTQLDNKVQVIFVAFLFMYLRANTLIWFLHMPKQTLVTWFYIRFFAHPFHIDYIISWALAAQDSSLESLYF
jgi:hypothetical protein